MPVHGLGSSQNYFTALIPAFTTAQVRCIALDTTGQGRSPYTGIEQSVRSLAADIVGSMDALSIDKAVLVGHSMAGLTCPAVAAAHPARVAALLLVGPVFPNPGAAATFAQRIEKVESEGMQPMADTIPWAAVGSEASSLQHAFIRELLLASQPGGYVSLCRVIHSVNVDASNGPEYGKVTCPVYIVAGDEDKSGPVEGCKKLLEAAGTPEGEKKMVVLEKTGHWMCVERPERVAQELMRFWRAVQ